MMSSSLKEDHLMLRAHPSRFAAALLALALGPASVFAQTTDAVGVVTTLSGQATVARIGLTEPASMRFRDPVFTRDRISTGEKSIVRVLLGGKAVVTARELSVLTINEEPLRSTVILDSGKVGASVLKDRMKPGETIEFRTPNAVAVVRGTVLVVEVTEGPVPAGGGAAPITTTVSVIRGAVDVFALKGGTMTPARVGGQESVSVTGSRLDKVRALTPEASRGLTADLEVAPEQQHQTKNVPVELRRAIGAREQAKAAALVGALAPARGDKKVDGTSALTGTVVTEATGMLDGVADTTTALVGTVDQVLLEASSPVLKLGSIVGTTGTVTTPTTDTVLGQGTVGTVSGSSVGTVGGVVTGISTAVGGTLTGTSLTSTSLTGTSLTSTSLTGTSLTGTSLTGTSLTGTSLTGGSVTGGVLKPVGTITDPLLRR
jgi:hypothetical protein